MHTIIYLRLMIYLYSIHMYVKTFGNFDKLFIAYKFVLNLSLSDLSHCKLINK